MAVKKSAPARGSAAATKQTDGANEPVAKVTRPAVKATAPARSTAKPAASSPASPATKAGSAAPRKAVPDGAQAATKARPAKAAATKKTAGTPATRAGATGKAAATRKAAEVRPSAAAKKAEATATRDAATKPATARAATRPAPARKAAAPGRLRVREDESPWTTKELDGVRRDLEADVRRLRAEISAAEIDLVGLMRDAGDGSGDDQADAGAKTFEREQEISVANNSREMLDQSEHALGRITDGSYGICESCGNPIGKLRLQAFPRATLCLTCKQKQERR
jgi:RNA polymerase-binding protein DksA